MKKKIGKIIICLISIIYILMTVKSNISIAYEYSLSNRDSIVVWNSSTTSDPKTVTLSDGKEVALVQGGYKTNATYRSTDGALQCSIVCQPNVYCAQHGTSLSQGSYRASKKFDVDNNQYAGRVLAYILNQNESTSLSKDWVTPYQVALWKYLYNYKNKDNATDAKRIVNNIIINNVTGANEDQDLSQNDIYQANNIIKDAENYANTLNTTPTLSVSKENGNIKITTNASKYEIYLGGQLYKEGENSQFTSPSKSIPISTALNYTRTGQVTVQVKSLVKQYKASYRILYSYYDVNDGWPAGQQRLIVVTGLEETTKKNASTILTEPLDANVSMQKYITSVSDIDGNNKVTVDSRDSYLSRENDMNNNDSDSLGVVYKTKYDRDPSKSKSKKTSYKYDNPIKIDFGDKVTYTIEVSNNGEYPVENVVIRDAFPQIGDNYVIDVNSVDLNKNGNTMQQKVITNTSGIKCGMNYLIESSIPAGATKTFTVTMKFDSESLKKRGDIIANTAWVEAVYSNLDGSAGLKGRNLKRDYRTADRDYVQMKQYAVTLEKYAVGINQKRLEDFNGNGSLDSQDALFIPIYKTNGEITDSARNKIERYGDINKDGQISSADATSLNQMVIGAVSVQNYREGSAEWQDTSKYKQNNPVQVEKGDKVTFKIKLTNTGEGNIKVSKITDTFTNDTTKGLSLESISGNGGGTISGNTITFNNPQEIKAGESIFVEVTFTVNTNLNSEYILKNTAEVKEIKNKNNKSVLEWDKDGTTNNKDSDYLKVLKQYAVSLEKFVSKVNNNSLITDTNNLEYNCNVSDRSGHPKYASNGYNKQTDANKVRVEPGDTVTYTIRLKNTSPTGAGHSAIKVSKIEDTHQKINNNCYLEYDSSYSITENGGGAVTESGNKLTITFREPVEIYPERSLDITIRFKVVVKGTNTATYQTLENTAEVKEIKNRNGETVNDVDGNGNNSDSDYIKTKIYAVGLEKFVSKVNNKDLITNTNNQEYNCNLSSRAGYPTYDSNEEKRTKKSNDPVRVEPGDKVTFTISVKNTGTDYINYGKISTTTITEEFTNNTNCKLVYDSISNATYSSNKITFEKEILPKSSADLTITFKVDVTGDATKEQKSLNNKASIESTNEIKNKNNVTVKDSDGLENNIDSDYIKTKIYKVALEKYVTQVNGNALSKEAGANYNVKSLSERKGNPIYDSTNKENDIVNLETGDTVTFAIIVKNIGDNYINYGTIKTLEITDESSTKLQYNNVCQGARYNNGTITGVPSIAVGNEATIYLGYTVTLDTTQTKEKVDLVNTATIKNNTIKNKHDVLVKEDKNSRQDEDNTDSDYLRTKVYAVSLEKFVSKVEMNGTDITDAINMGPKKDGMDRPREGYAEHNYNNSETTEENCDKTKRRNPVTTVTGDTITYTIKLKNDSEAKTGIDTNKNSNHDTTSYNTAVKIGKVIDYLPNGMKYNNKEYTDNAYGVRYSFKTENNQTITSGRLLQPGETATVTITAEVIEDKMSLNILKNVAEIDENSLTNKNGKQVYDTTENNNKDADYIQLNYKHDPNPNNPNANPDSGNNAFFAGTVWNDMAPDKESEYYNTIMDNSERKLSGIKVDLYRNSYKKENNEINYTPITKTIVATKITDKNGNYSFGDQDIHLENQRENYIKGPKISNEDNRWAGYYGYYIVFTYDGITYTSTNNGIYFEDIYNSTKDYTKDSNASEYNVNESKISGYTTRKDFNSKFATINNSTKIQDKEIQYDRVNESGYIPESTYKYDPEIMSMKSLTKEIDLSTFMGMGTDKCLERSKYIGLGLRGRDIFDLELTSDVSKVKVKVNGITGTYDYPNKIGVRRGDVDKSYYQDMANKYISKMRAEYVGELNGKDGQKVRQTDLKTDNTKSDYDDNQLLQSILVTYKIKVSNASKTEGKATKVINYFDKNYKTDNITVTNGTVDKIDSSNSKYNSILINANSNEIDITYELNNAKGLLKDLGDKKLTTYNMSEIYEYTTTQYGDKDERTYTKGILDKDSAPGSVETEKASLTGKTFSEDTTLNYYFKGENLDKLKYEDDTYATPTLYFTTPGDVRVLSGTVFEDYTDVYTGERIRTGNGVKDTIEPGIEGARVELIEKTTSGNKVRYTTTTNQNGNFVFTNYLPGEYIIKYFYGDNEKTFYIGDTNTKSYNGEDFQATNNYQDVSGADVQKLSTEEDYWYSYNYEKGISTAKDIANQRKDVSKNACELTDDQMEILNNVRDGKIKTENEDSKEVREKLNMAAQTNNFTLTIEKSVKGEQYTEFTTYEVTDMNFGIAEVPVTTIDLQKHVQSFEIKDSTEENIIASAEIKDKYIVEINEHNITDENKYNKVKEALEKAGVTGYTFKSYTTGNYGESVTNENITVNKSVNKDEINKLRGYLITYSIPNIITITPTWSTKGNVLAGVKSTNTVLDVSIEDAKLQGAKLQITYDIAVSMYAEKDFSGTEPLQPSIDKVIDLIDNGVSYSDALNTGGQWSVANASGLQYGDSDSTESGGLQSYPTTSFNTTIVQSTTKDKNGLLNVISGYTEETTVTVERVLTSQDTSIQDIIKSSIDAFEYQNTVKILQLDYTNSKVNIDGIDIKNKDRIRTPERYIIVPGKHHDSASSETIAIHPPTGDTSTHTLYYIIGAASLAVLAVGVFGIKKFVLKGKSTKK